MKPFQDFFLKTYQDLWKFPGFVKPFQDLWNISRIFETFPGFFLKHSRIFLNFPGFVKTFQDFIWKLPRICENFPGFYLKTSQDFWKFSGDPPPFVTLLIGNKHMLVCMWVNRWSALWQTLLSKTTVQGEGICCELSKQHLIKSVICRWVSGWHAVSRV